MFSGDHGHHAGNQQRLSNPLCFLPDAMSEKQKGVGGYNKLVSYRPLSAGPDRVLHGMTRRCHDKQNQFISSLSLFHAAAFLNSITGPISLKVYVYCMFASFKYV